MTAQEWVNKYIVLPEDRMRALLVVPQKGLHQRCAYRAFRLLAPPGLKESTSYPDFCAAVSALSMYRPRLTPASGGPGKKCCHDPWNPTATRPLRASGWPGARFSAEYYKELVKRL